jgi:hypothetical protein
MRSQWVPAVLEAAVVHKDQMADPAVLLVSQPQEVVGAVALALLAVWVLQLPVATEDMLISVKFQAL